MEKAKVEGWKPEIIRIRNLVNMLYSGARSAHDTVWKKENPNKTFIVPVDYLGEKCFGNMAHIIIQVLDNMSVKEDLWKAIINALEPNYGEKVQILEEVLDSEGKIAIEVFPRQRNLVDAVNLYHIWVGEMSKFPFSLKETTELPADEEWQSEKIGDLDIEYRVRTKKTDLGKVAYLYLRRKDGKELCWREKQMLKNELQSEDLTAVEIISKGGIGKPTCLLFIPFGYYLDFGLHISN